MSDIRLVQGLLITICLSLVVGVAFTLAEMGQTDTSVLAKLGPLPSVTAPATTPPKTTSPPTPAAKTSALDMAPQGTWGVFVLDVAKILSVPDLRDKVASSFPAGLNPGWVKQVTFFLMPSASGGMASGAGAVTLAAGDGPKLEAWLKSKGTPVTVGGATAYKVNTGSAPAGGAAGAPAMAGPVPAPKSVLVTVLNDTTALAAEDQQSLGALLTASKSGGAVSPELKKFFSDYSGASIYGAMLPSPQLLAALQGQGQGNDMGGFKGAAIKVDLGSVYDITAAARFNTAQQAQKVVTEAQSGIAKMKQQAAAAPNPQAAAMMKPMLDAVSKLSMKVQGADAIFNVKLTLQDLMKFAGMAGMMVGGAGGGMMAPPGGAMTPMPAGHP